MLIPVIEPLKEKLSILTLLGVYSSEKLRPPGGSSRFLWGTGSWCGRRVRQSVRVPRRGAACSAGHRHTPGSRDAAGWSHGRTPTHAVPRAHPSVGRMPPAPAPGPCRRRGSDPGSAGGAGAAGLLSSAHGHAWHTPARDHSAGRNPPTASTNAGGHKGQTRRTGRLTPVAPRAPGTPRETWLDSQPNPPTAQIPDGYLKIHSSLEGIETRPLPH